MKKSSGKEELGRSLEDVFREGFSNAEATPSSKLWDNLDRELENQELKHYKRYAFWYRSVAAACLVILLMAGGLFWKNNSGQNLLPQPGNMASADLKMKGQGNVAAREQNNSPQGKVTADDAGPSHSVFGQFLEKEAKNSASASSNSTNQSLAQGRIKQTSPINQGNIGTEALVSNSPEAAGATGENLSVTERSLTQDWAVKQDIASNRPSGKASSVVDQKVLVSGSGHKVEQKNGLGTLAAKSEGASMLDSADQEKVPTILLQKSKAALATVDVKEEKENSKSAEVSSKWSLAVAYAPQYANAPIKAGGGSARNFYSSPDLAGQPSQYAAYQAALNEYEQTYEPAYSYQATVGASYHLNEKWYLESGLLYGENKGTTQHSYVVNGGSVGQSSNGVRLSPLPVLNNSGFDSNAGSAGLVTRTAPYTTHYRYQQLGVPVKIGFRHYFNKLFAYASGGFSANLLLKNSIEPETSQLQEQHYTFNDPTSPFNSWQVSSIASAGIGYTISEKVTVSMAPEVTYALTPFFKNAQYQKNNLQMGISIESKWRIIK